jgi:hypothetical protein
MDGLTLFLTLGGCFLLAGTIVTVIAIYRAPMGFETEEGFFEQPDSDREHQAMPGATLRFH